MRALLLALALSGCMKKAPTEADSTSMLAIGAALDPGLEGTWELSGSTAVWTISATRRGAAVSGVDSSDGEVFEISDVRADGRTLRFLTRMPSTDHATAQTWLLTEPDRCTVTVVSAESVTLSATRRPD